MKRSNDHSLGSLIQEFIRIHNLQEKITETRITDIWEKIMGSHIARYTEKITLDSATLKVALSSSVLRNELSMGKSTIIRNINAELGKDLIREIIFR